MEKRDTFHEHINTSENILYTYTECLKFIGNVLVYRDFYEIIPWFNETNGNKLVNKLSEVFVKNDKLEDY